MIIEVSLVIVVFQDGKKEMIKLLLSLIVTVLLINPVQAHIRLAEGKTIEKHAWVCSKFEDAKFFITGRKFPLPEKFKPVLRLTKELNEWSAKRRKFKRNFVDTWYREYVDTKCKFHIQHKMKIKKILYEDDVYDMDGSAPKRHYWILDTDVGYAVIYLDFEIILEKK